ncbi:Chloride channel protein [hydrothermal vent metagenome]|uniref:Chloride channel protein n=1 Tax=hydrothermal vent metagenome TaxID=652676 RepID=A0A1W1CF05_9ZZZZ
MKKQLKYHFPQDLKSFVLLLIASIITIIVIDIFLQLSSFAQHSFKKINILYPWITFFITPIGFALIITFVKKQQHFVQSAGIPQAIAAMDSRNKKIRHKLLSFRIAFEKIFFICIAMLFGAPIGIEGPSIHIGASIFYGFNHLIQFKRKLMLHALITIGGSAGLIVAFNAPLAGLIFAYEELGRNVKKQGYVLIALVGILVYFVAIFYRGNDYYLGDYSNINFNFITLWQLIPLAIISGLLGGVFAKSTLFLLKKLTTKKTIKIIIIAFVLGLIIAIFNFLSQGNVSGSGHLETQKLLALQNLGWEFVILKFFATLTSLISTIPGGLFMPTISIGAGLGSELSIFYTQNPQIIIIFTMITYLSATIRAPLTATVVILEMTNAMPLLVPAILLALIANFISKKIQKTPLYEALSQQFLNINS